MGSSKHHTVARFFRNVRLWANFHCVSLKGKAKMVLIISFKNNKSFALYFILTQYVACNFKESVCIIVLHPKHCEEETKMEKLLCVFIV